MEYICPSIRSLPTIERARRVPMAQCAPQVFAGITPEQYAVLTAKAKAAGIDLSGNNGTASKFGVEVTWSYAPDKQELTLQCLKAPFFVSGEDVDAKFRALVKETLAGS
jgi:hypothetical protein